VLPANVTATTSMAEAIEGAQYAIHAVPVQHSRAFLESVKVCQALNFDTCQGMASSFRNCKSLGDI